MNTFKPSPRLHAIAILLCLTLCAAIPAVAAPKKSASPEPTASPAGSPVAAEKARPFPFNSIVVSVDKAAKTFQMGKNKVHTVHVLPETKVKKGENAPAAFEEIVVGMEVRGAVTKRLDGDYDAVSVKIGPKAAASPAAAKPTPKR